MSRTPADRVEAKRADIDTAARALFELAKVSIEELADCEWNTLPDTSVSPKPAEVVERMRDLLQQYDQSNPETGDGTLCEHCFLIAVAELLEGEGNL